MHTSLILSLSVLFLVTMSTLLFISAYRLIAVPFHCLYIDLLISFLFICYDSKGECAILNDALAAVVLAVANEAQVEEA